MTSLFSLVMMQLKDKIDLGFVKTKKTLIRKIVLTVLKFAVVAAASFLVLWLLNIFVFSPGDTPQVLVVILTFLYGISLLTCTVGLVKSLYFDQDNRVLITFPVETGQIFLSKIIVYYFYELKREYSFILPMVLGCGIVNLAGFTFWFIPWTMLVMLIVPALPVLVGGLLSIPALFVARLVNRYPVLKILLFAVIAGLLVWAIVWLIGLLPEDIDLITQGATLIRAIKSFLLKFQNAVPPVKWLVWLFIGAKGADNATYSILSGRTFLILGCLIVVIALLFGAVYLLSKPLFFKMMSKSFEFEKRIVDKQKLNKPHSKWYAFTLKEFKLCIMNIEVSMSFLAVYIAVPLMIYLLNSLYAAMNTRLKGDVMAWAFNLLIMLLPMLSSNSVIATLYSKEGRAGYMKKTEPVNIILPLTAKLFSFLVLSIPSIVATVIVFGLFSGEMFRWYDLCLLALTLLLFHYGHIFFSANSDIMNPQNEQYATVGESTQNPNETKSTILAFAISAAVALFGFVLLSESAMGNGRVTTAMIKLFAISLVFFVAMLVHFIRSVKAYYYER